MNQPYDIDLKTFNFNQSMDPNDIQSHSNGESQNGPNQKGLNPMIKDSSFCIFAAKTESFWQAFYGFDAASRTLERLFWWLQLHYSS